MSNNGVVFGAMFDDEFNVVHGIVDNVNDLAKLRGSKYVQSDLKNCFNLAKEFLKSGRQVFFTGTPCQIAGLKSFLQFDYPNLFTQDVICHGVPSPLVWEKYRDGQISKYNSNLSYFSFRNKEKGWINYQVKMNFDSGASFSESHNKNPLIKVFIGNKCLRDSCYNCAFKGTNRSSDITLADFWGANIIRPATYNKLGTSLILIHSEKGQALLDEIRDKIELHKIGIALPSLFNPSLTHSAKRSSKRGLFMEKIKTLTFDEALKEIK